MLAALLVSANLSAAPTANLTTGVARLSASAHSIDYGAEAHSQIYEAQYGINPNLGASLEVARISDVDGRTYIGTLYFQRPFDISQAGARLSTARYAGITHLFVEDNFDDSESNTGFTLGLIADYSICPELTVYGRAGIAFLDETLWTLDAGIRYEVRPQWFLSLGYRDYEVGGSSLGGFLAGATYQF